MKSDKQAIEDLADQLLPCGDWLTLVGHEQAQDLLLHLVRGYCNGETLDALDDVLRKLRDINQEYAEQIYYDQQADEADHRNDEAKERALLNEVQS